MKQSVSVSKSKVKAVIGEKDSRDTLKVLSKAKSGLLLDWYDKNRRIMPWRALPHKVPNPYYVWLSEIMLQQTTVASVGPYFQKFIKRWPELNDLAKASLEEVMQMWAGLGYYRRARLLHECARYLHRHYEGRLPQSEEELLQLPGFGSYTAAAVGAIAFNQRTNVVDGNVERVVARLFAISTPLPAAKKILRDLAGRLLPSGRYGDYAQALMDLGATVCTPQNPKCGLCPWSDACRGRDEKIAETLPRRVKKAARPVKKAIAFVLINRRRQIFVRKRPPHGLLGGMMEIPSSSWTEGEMPDIKQVLDRAPLAGKWILRPGTVRHIFTHFELQVAVATSVTSKPVRQGKWVALDEIEKEALPSLMHKIIRHVREWL